jgi:hypothetical protein
MFFDLRAIIFLSHRGHRTPPLDDFTFGAQPRQFNRSRQLINISRHRTYIATIDDSIEETHATLVCSFGLSPECPVKSSVDHDPNMGSRHGSSVCITNAAVCNTCG